MKGRQVAERGQQKPGQPQLRPESHRLGARPEQEDTEGSKDTEMDMQIHADRDRNTETQGL